MKSTPSAEVVLPPMLSPRAMTVPGIGGTWCAVRCKSRNEKSLAADMLQAGFDYFVPLVRRVDKSRHVSFSPPEYLRGLVFASSQDAPEPGYAVPTRLHYFLQDHHAYYGVITVSQAAQARFQLELQEVYADIVNGNYEDESNTFAVVGKICRIRDGAYQGQVVEVDRIVSPSVVVVAVATMGDVNPMEIDVRSLEATDEPGPRKRRLAVA